MPNSPAVIDIKYLAAFFEGMKNLSDEFFRNCEKYASIKAISAELNKTIKKLIP